MPAKSKSQQRLMAAAEHGADFPMAKQIQSSMSLAQMRDFARGPMAGKPEHVKKAAARPAPMRPAAPMKAKGHPHSNLGAWLHPKKGSK